MLLHVIALTFEQAIENLPKKYAHIGARRDNSMPIFSMDFPVDDHQNEEDHESTWTSAVSNLYNRFRHHY